jgi:hypothetical protein
MINYINEKVTMLSRGDIKIEKSTLSNKIGKKTIPLKSITVLKGDMNWFHEKQEDLLNGLSMKYYVAMKESFQGTSGLINKWMHWGQTPIGGHKLFTYPRNRRRRRVKLYMSLMWKKYKTTFKGLTYFDEYEKLRALDFQLNKIIQMGDLSAFYLEKMTQCW